MEKDNKNKVYFFCNGNFIKIGYTKQNLQKRLQQLNTGSEYQLYILGYIYGEKELEAYLHNKFAKDRIRMNGEWFRPSKELIDYINDNNGKHNISVDFDKSRNKVVTYFTIK